MPNKIVQINISMYVPFTICVSNLCIILSARAVFDVDVYLVLLLKPDFVKRPWVLVRCYIKKHYYYCPLN